MIAVDTNILVYAHREDSPWHSAAVTCVTRLAEGGAPWAIPWPCVHEFLAIVTHPKIYRPATPLTSALDQVGAWIESCARTVQRHRHLPTGNVQALASRAHIKSRAVIDMSKRMKIAQRQHRPQTQGESITKVGR